MGAAEHHKVNGFRILKWQAVLLIFFAFLLGTIVYGFIYVLSEPDL